MFNHTSRRSFVLGCGSSIAGSVSFMRAEKLLANANRQAEVDGIQDPRLKEIIQTAISSAMDAGATYADARLSHSEFFAVSYDHPRIIEHMGFGVRVISNGYWGFASSSVWSNTEASRLGKAAVVQANANAIVQAGNIELAAMSNVQSGHWTMPVKDDPFEMAFDEVADFQNALSRFIRELENHSNSMMMIEYERISKAFGSSSGQYTTQKLYKTGGYMTLGLQDDNGATFLGSFQHMTPAGLGFEYLRDRPLREKILIFHDDLMHSLRLPVTDLDVGRYNTLFDSGAIGNLLNKTIGRPTEVDTALGFEANTGGVGFIDPAEMLGSYKLGSNKLNVTGDRSAEGSVGRVKWDDEGAVPAKVDIIKDGIVANMQCNREGAVLIKDHFNRTSQTCKSHGCAYSPTAMDVPMVHSMDLTIQPAIENNSLDSLRKDMEKGIEVVEPYIDVDFQYVTGFTIGNVFEIKNGKRIGRFNNGSVMFRTPELWNNMIDLGGSGSVERYGISSKYSLSARKGQPPQSSASSVFSVPALFKEITLLRTR